MGQRRTTATGKSKRTAPRKLPPIEEGVPYVPVYDDLERDQLGYPASPTNFRHPCWIDEDRTLLPTLYTAAGLPVIAFDPVPQVRRRRVGWDEERQRAFVMLLAETPSIGFAARKLGMSRQSVYRLLERPGAEQFAKAVDMAVDHGLSALRATGVMRGLGEDAVPVFRHGRHVRTELRRNDQLAMTILRQASRDQDAMRHATQLRWRRKQEWAAFDAEKAIRAAEEIAYAARYQAELEEMMERGKKMLRIPGVRPL